MFLGTPELLLASVKLWVMFYDHYKKLKFWNPPLVFDFTIVSRTRAPVLRERGGDWCL